MNTLIIYHAPHCNDGFTAAWVVFNTMKELNRTSYLYPMDYGIPDEEDLLEFLTHNEYEHIYVVDFSLRLELLEKIAIHFRTNTTVIDHHKSAFNMYAPDLEVDTMAAYSVYNHKLLTDIRLDNNESGASLCWKVFNHQRGVPKLVEYVKDRDLYRFIHPDTKAFHMYLASQVKTISNWDFIALALENQPSHNQLIARGQELLDVYNYEVDGYAGDAETITIYGETGLMVQCPGKYDSDVGNALAEACGTFGLIYHELDDGDTLKCSLRSMKDTDYDVEVLAKHWGGGGHKHAAGFKVSISELEENYWDKYR